MSFGRSKDGGYGTAIGEGRKGDVSDTSPIARTVVTRNGEVLMYSSTRGGALLAVGRVYRRRVKAVSGWTGQLEKPIRSREVGWPSDSPLRTRREVVEWLEDLARDAIGKVDTETGR